jgi:hypothetical protein
MTPYGTSDALIVAIPNLTKTRLEGMYSSKKPVTFTSAITAVKGHLSII